MNDKSGAPFSVRQMLVTDSIIGLISPFLLLWLSTRWSPQTLWFAVAGGQLYSHAIGTLAHVSMAAVYPRLLGRRPAVRWGIVTLLFVAGTAVGCLVAGLGMMALGANAPEHYWRNYQLAFRFGLLVTFAVGFGGAVFETFRARLERTTLQLRTRELERERALKAAAEARLSSLESRIHPHFLFNALNSISALIREDPERAERLIGRMAALLRFSLDSTRLGLVALEDEMRIVADYLEIESTRFGERLRYQIDIAPGTTGEVPPLSVQTLVENSVKYAVAPRREGGSIAISARTDGDSIVIDVRDDGPGFDLRDVPAGHGIDTLQSRLLMSHGDAARLEARRAGGGMSVRISVPRTQVEAVR